MHSMKKRRSSIKRSAASLGLSEPVAAVGTRPDRRISFSGKMSVREFCGEEEPQTWNKSYELSDHVNASGPEASSVIAAGISRSVVIGSTEESGKLRYDGNKENIHWDPMTAGAVVSKSLTSRCERSIAAAGRIVQQIEENNADVTLVSDRDRVRHLRSRTSSSGSDNEHPSITFSMYEHDYRVLQTDLSSYSEMTEDYLRELHFNDCVMERRSVKKDKSETVLCNEEMVESICGKYDMGELVATSQTICMNERIEGEDERCSHAYGLTQGAVEDMQFSPIAENGQTNEKYTQNIDTTSFAKAMEVESPVYEVSRKRLFEVESTNLVQVQISKSFNDSLQAAPLNVDEMDKDCNLRNHSNMIMDISSSNGNNIAEVDEPRALLEPEVEHPGHKVLPNLELKLVAEGEPEVKSCSEIMNGENDVRKVVSGPLAGTAKGGNIRKVVVRKMCAPTTSVERSGLKRFRFSQKKASPQCPVKEVTETTGPVVDLGNLNNISLINAGDISVASNYSSPLFPAEFVSSNKKLNFRQLNDEIERGQIQIYSQLGGKLLSARRKSVGKQLFPMPKGSDMDKHAKDGEAIEGSEEDMRVSLCGNLSKHAKSALGLSEACNMSDNTSFLIKAKLGDETASRNSSSSNQRETIHLKEDVNITIVCDEDTLNPECIVKGKPECCNEGFAKEGNSSLGRIGYAQENQATPIHQKINTESRRRTILELQDIILDETHDTDVCVKTLHVSGSKENICETGTENRVGCSVERNSVSAILMSTTKVNARNENKLKRSSRNKNFRSADKSIQGNTQNLMNDDESAIFENNFDDNAREVAEGSGKRRTIIFSVENNITLDECDKSSQINQNNDFRMASINESSSGLKEKHFTDEYKLSVKPLNAAKALFMRQNALCVRRESMEDSFTQKLNETRAAMFGDSKKKLEKGLKEETLINGHEESMDVSPIVVRDQQEQLRRLGTPHRSILEFECLELEAMQEQQRYEEMETVKEERHKKSLELSIICCESEDKPSLKLRRQTTHNPIPIEMDVSGLQPLENENVSNLSFVSPIASEFIRKRLTSNLTPNFPVAKKRQTLVFHNCDVEESVVYIDDQTKEIKRKETKYEATAAPQWGDNNTELRPKGGDNSICKMNSIAALHGSIERIANNMAEGNSLNVSDLYSLTPTNIENMRQDGVDLSKSTAASHISVRINKTDKNKSNKCCPTPEKWDEIDTNQSLDTIQIPRKAMAFIQQHEKSIRLPASGNDTVVNHTLSECEKQQSAFFTFEANPITISDVSAHYLAQQNNRKTNREEGHENTTIRFLPDCELSEIDNTRLTLVESLISESVEVDVDDEHDKVLGEWECDEVSVGHCLQKAEENEGDASFCRKCLNFKEENRSSIGETLVLPPLPSLPCPGLKRLLRLRQRPAIADVHEYWRRKSLELTFSSENLSSNGAQLLEMEDKNEDVETSADCNITALISDIERMEMQVGGVDFAQCSFRKHPTFVQRLDEILSDKLHNWIFDYQMQHRGVFIFSHKMLITFSIVMLYEETDLFGNSIKILNIEVQNSRVAQKNWKPIDFVMDFQFRLELPVDLKSACVSSDERGIMKVLQDIDKICVDVVVAGNYLWRLVCSEQASLKRDNGQTIVRKIVREVVAGGYYQQVEKTEYKVELTNLKTLSFKNIIFPPLHAFNESIQFLPIGLDFLHAFLRKPGEYLKKKNTN